MMRRLRRRQEGRALILVLAFMALGVPLVTSSLGLASTLSIDSRVKTGIAKSSYAAIGGSDHALYRLVHESGYRDALLAGVPHNYPVTVNGQQVSVTVLKVTEPPSDIPPPPADNSRRLQTSKVVTPTTAMPNVLTTFSYTITVKNEDDQVENLRKIHDELPPGFSYVAGSTSGVTSNDPNISGQELTWNLAGLSLVLQPQESVTLAFDAQASVPQGIYCNEAWAEPGNEKTSSGKTAIVTVGSPGATLCQGSAVRVTKTVDPPVAPANTLTTYTYTISVENVGTDVLNITLIRDSLPADFLYVVGSTTGDITAADPTATMKQGRQRLDWELAPAVQVQPAETKTLVFEAQASVGGGDYWNEVWVTLDEFANPAYTWPSALVTIMGVFETSATDGAATAEAEVWIGVGTHVVMHWEVTR